MLSAKMQSRKKLLYVATAALVAIGSPIYLFLGATATLIFAEFITVPIALGLIIETRLKKRISNQEDDKVGHLMIGGNKVKIKVDWNYCMGAASCVQLAPKVFHLDWEKRKSFFDPAPLVLLDEKGPILKRSSTRRNPARIELSSSKMRRQENAFILRLIHPVAWIVLKKLMLFSNGSLAVLTFIA
jgi:hypothetical protein